MNVALLLDGGVTDHWPDILVAAFIAVTGWLLRRAISDVDDHQAATDAEAKKQGDKINDHEVRITVMEKFRRQGRQED